MFEVKNWNWMAEKNRDRNQFYYTYESFKRYFSGEKNDEEQVKTTLLIKQMKDCLNNKIYHDLAPSTVYNGPSVCLLLGYTAGYGYYALEDNDRGHYSVIYGLPSEDINIAVLMIIRYLLWNYALDDENQNQAEYRNDFACRFSKYDWLEYEPCLYYAEYCLNKWKILFDNLLPINVVEYYEAYLNDVTKGKDNEYSWKYSNEKGKFVLLKFDEVLALDVLHRTMKASRAYVQDNTPERKKEKFQKRWEDDLKDGGIRREIFSR